MITLLEYRDRTPLSEENPKNPFWFDEDSVDLLERVFSEKHQWLPTDFEVSATGRVRPLGYINNLHPVDHKEAHTTLSSILERFLPLFEHVVSDVLSPARPYAIQVAVTTGTQGPLGRPARLTMRSGRGGNNTTIGRSFPTPPRSSHPPPADASTSA